MARPRACVVVIGDFERSPRMKYHTLSLAKLNYDVDVVAYLDTPVSSEISDEHRIHFHPIKNYNSRCSNLPRLIGYFYKALLQFLGLFRILLSLKKPKYFLLQNPPSIPTIPVVYIVSRILGVRFIVDWHNYGFTILALSLGPSHILVSLCRWCEGFFGSRADYSFCVSEAMAKDLKIRWNINAIALYDRPAPAFKPLELKDKCQFLSKIAHIYPEFKNIAGTGSRMCKKVDGDYQELDDRPILIMSSTSWTEDEDFSVLLNALEEYDQNNSSLPSIICVITGKGPLKDYYSNMISSKKWQKVSLVTPWLNPEDYPKMVASADLGISLHTSSSNLDLPMKIIDMFGCAIPVLSIKYDCLGELVTDGVNGLMFSNSRELTELLLKLLKSPRNHISEMRSNLEKNRKNFSWSNEWQKQVKFIFDSN